ncbi:hypothetical protein UXP90_17915 [Enterobacter kobei]|uniref:hypothetical protein n=1 Tax=Enterobacter TaxID=547 RepID=UPI000E41B203|nr:hypothetical protein [Enterobacter sp. AM17-18]RGD10922.1 hypothetical protein DW197_19435 [Enterobacter sp. AM17-18]
MFKGIRINNTIVFVVCMALLIFMREYYISIKSGLHVDESLSIILSSYKSIGFSTIGDGFIGATGDAIRREMYVVNGGILDAINDVGKLWVNNRDLPHSNIYYSLLRLWMTPLKDSNISNIVVWLAQMNIIFMCISFYFCVKLVHKLTGNITPSIICAFIAYTSHFAISNTTFLRPYQFQEMMFVIFTYYTLLVFDTTDIQRKGLVKYAAVTSVTFLTGYFSVFYILPVSLLILLNHRSICGHNPLKKILLFITLVISFSFIIYPRYFNINYRTTEAVGKVFSFKENIASSFKVFHDISISLPFIYLIAILGLLYLIYKTYSGCRHSLFSIWIVLSTSLFVILSIYFAPYKLARYAYPSIPMFALIFASFYSFAGKINATASFTILTFVSIFSASINADRNKVENLFLRDNYDCQSVHNNNKTLIIVKVPFKFNTLATCLDSNVVYNVIPLKEFESGFDTSKYTTILSDERINLRNYTLRAEPNTRGSYYFDVYRSN